MTVNEKIRESKFFLQKLVSVTDFDEIQYYFSAFLSSVSSIPDYLLLDYANKFNLGIKDKQHFDDCKFLKIAIEKQNKKAIKFIQWHIEKIQKIKNDNIAGDLLTKRNINIHKRTIKTDLDSISLVPEKFEKGDLFHTLQPAVGVTWKEFRKYVMQSKRELEESLKTNTMKKRRINMAFNWYIEDHKDMFGFHVCFHYFRLMKNLVKDTKRKF